LVTYTGWDFKSKKYTGLQWGHESKFSISYPYLINFFDFADNRQEGKQHQERGATQEQQDITMRMTSSCLVPIAQPHMCTLGVTA
jgi:hypothetical protein